MTKRSNISDNFQDNFPDVFVPPKFAIIVPNNEEALEMANQYSLISDYKKSTVLYKGIEMYRVHHTVFTHIPGYTHNTISTLYDGLNSLGRPYCRIFLITTAVSCNCVKEGVDNLVSIEKISNRADKDELDFFLPEGAQKMYPATVISECGQKLPKALQPCVQVLLNLNVMVDALTAPPQDLSTEFVVMAVNVDKIACKYKQAAARKLLFDKKHFQEFVRSVVQFVSRIANEQSLLMTPPPTCKKQRMDYLPLSELENELKETFSNFSAKERHTREKEIIEKFERDVLIMTLSPENLSGFARCLGLKNNEYENIQYEHNHKNPKEQIHCIIKEWFEKEGFQANLIKFIKALQDMKNKELYDNFLLRCYEVHNP